MAVKNSPKIVSNATGAGFADEPMFRRVGSVKLSEGLKAINLHFFEGEKFYSIPITDIKLMLYESKEGKSETIGVIREYPIRKEE
jgi:hypothetical protein